MRLPDLSLAVRNIFRRPGFAVVAITLLALGAGANAAVFSVVRGVLLQAAPLPGARSPGRASAPTSSSRTKRCDYWRERTRSFEQHRGDVAGLDDGPGRRRRRADQGHRRARVRQPVPDARRAARRSAAPSSPATPCPGAPQVAVISRQLVAHAIQRDPSVIGRGIQLDQEPHTIVGVMPAGFEIFGRGTDLWAPLPWDPSTPQSQGDVLAGRRRGCAAASTPEAATRELADLAPAMRKDLAKANDWGQTLRVQSLQESITGDVRPALLILLGAVGLILMLAAVNLGTLVLGRSIERVGEMALRTALGASRGRLIRQIVIEQAVLATARRDRRHRRGVAGDAGRSSRAFRRKCRGVGEIALDWTVLITRAGRLGRASPMVVALLPAVITARPNLQPLLRQSRTTDTPARRRALGALVAVQIALAVVLGIGSMLMLRSMWNLQRVDPGFNPNNVLTFRLQTTSKYRDMTRGLPYLQQVTERVKALPGVTDVGLVGHLPMSGYSWTMAVRRADRPLEPGATGAERRAGVSSTATTSRRCASR